MTSVDSVNSISAISRFTNPNRSNTSFAPSSQSSGGTSSSSGVAIKKPSFASIRNAFKVSSSKGHANTNNGEPPPMPAMDFYALNRSTSSLGSALPVSSRGTPVPMPNGQLSSRTGKTPNGHSYSKSYHTSTPSTSSDLAFAFGGSPPPPPLPSFRNRHDHSHSHFTTGRDTPDHAFDDEKIIMNPKTPSDFALHALFMRFATNAETMIETFLRQPLDVYPSLLAQCGPGVDSAFDAILGSLGKIAVKHSKPVIDSIMRWRRTQQDPVHAEVVQWHLKQGSATATQSTIDLSSTSGPSHNGYIGGGALSLTSSNASAIASAIVMANAPIASPTNLGFPPPNQIPMILNERKSLASIYIMCRALISVLESLPALSEGLAHSLEKSTFEQFKQGEGILGPQTGVSKGKGVDINYTEIKKMEARILGLLRFASAIIYRISCSYPVQIRASF